MTIASIISTEQYFGYFSNDVIKFSEYFSSMDFFILQLEPFVSLEKQKRKKSMTW